MVTTTLGRNATGLRGVSNLMLRIGRGVAARSVTVPLPADAQISWTVPGGDDTFTGTIPWPDRGISKPDALMPNMPVRVEDRRTGEIIWQGRVADSGFSGDRSGQEFRVNAVGSVKDLDMMSVLKNYVDRSMENWTDLHVWPSGDMNTQEASGFVAHGNDALQVPPEGMLEFPWPAGTTQNTNTGQTACYLVGSYSAVDMQATDTGTRSTGVTAVVPEIHAFRFSRRESFANANNIVVRAASAVAGSTIILYTAAALTNTQVDVSLREGVTGNWTRTDLKFLYVDQRRSGANVTASGDGWFRFANFQVIGKRYTRYGLDITSVRVEALSPYEIVEDMLGTVLNGKFDPGQIISDTGILIDQASWWTATPVSEILDAATAWNPDAWWGVWAPANPDSLPRLDYRAWNTTPRYALDDTATVELGGGGEEWANSALITYVRQNGVQTTTRGTVSVTSIGRIFGSGGAGTAAFNTRDLSVDLTDQGPMTRAQALTRAGNLIKESGTEKVSGSATVRGPIQDDTVGRLVQPWEIRPGWPILVGAAPVGFTSGSPVTLDGESTFRLSKVTYSAAEDSATLEFDGGRRRMYKGAAPSTRKYRFVPQSRRRHSRSQR